MSSTFDFPNIKSTTTGVTPVVNTTNVVSELDKHTFPVFSSTDELQIAGNKESSSNLSLSTVFSDDGTFSSKFQNENQSTRLPKPKL